ncbi:MAG: lipid-A-disaccharide synthase [Deltaproteobacteria bacterium]|nr:MAG: lipid-A-disaccharide synthase [Deltaproteobacteria bacterium]
MAQIAVVAGETSGDIHAGNLVSAILSRAPGTSIWGIGGERIAAAGGRLLLDYSSISAMGFVEALSNISALKSARRMMVEEFKANPPDLFIPVDFGGFNLPLAEIAAKMGIPVIYFIPPKAWAWRRSRVKRVRRTAERLMTILPFEESFWRENGVPCDYVGSPILDHLDPVTHAEEPDLVGLLPGSRRSEVTRLWPLMVEAARIMSKTKKLRFVAPRAEGLDPELLSAPPDIDIEILPGSSQEVMERARVLIIASGTATLECSLIGKPMVVVYRFSPLSLFLVKRLVKIDYMALPNLIAGEKIVPELLQAKPEEAASLALKLLEDGPTRSTMVKDLQAVRESMGERGASARAASIVCGFLEERGLLDA